MSAFENLKQRLLNSDLDRLEYFKMAIDLFCCQPFLSIIAVDTQQLAMNFALWIKEFYTKRQVSVYQIKEPDDITNNFFRQEDAVKVFVFPIRNEPNKELIGSILIKRDGIAYENKQLVLIVSIADLDYMMFYAYDLVQVSHFTDRFTDQKALLEHLTAVPQDTVPHRRFRELQQELRLALEQGKSERMLMSKLIDLGNLAYRLNFYDQALDYYLWGLYLAQKKKDKWYISAFTGNIGNLYKDKGELDKALEYYHKSLEIAKKIGDKGGQASVIGNIGLVYHRRGELDKALEYYLKSLEIAKNIGEKFGQAILLGNIGQVYLEKGELNKALEYFEQSLKIVKEIGDKYVQASILTNIGNVYKHRGDLDKALEYYHKSLEIKKEFGDSQSQATTLGNIGEVYLQSGEYDKAKQYIEQSIQLVRENSFQFSYAEALLNMAWLYIKLSEPDKAQDYLSRAEDIIKSLHDKAEEFKLAYIKIQLLRLTAKDEEAELLLKQAITEAEKLGFGLWVKRLKEL